jgi:YD repeat-containing protein
MRDSIQAFKFWAFVSYSHHDKNSARQLVRSLEKLHVPPAFRDLVAGAPSRFAPVFIDEEETAANSRLSDEMQNALRQSRKLIVVCSPFSANSAYVADEIRYFKQIGRSRDILCFIVSGVPNATDTGQAYLECFAPPLRFDDQDNTISIAQGDRPLAASIGGGGASEWNHALQQIVAGLLDISLGDLARSRATDRTKKYAALALLLASAAGALWFAAWALFLPHITYAKNFVRRSGVWEEVDRIDAADVARHAQSYVFYRRGAYGQPQEVKSVNPYGTCHSESLRSLTDDVFSFSCTNSKACGARFSYSAKGIATEEIIDQYGNAVEIVSYQENPGRATAAGDDGKKVTYGVVTSAIVGCSRRKGMIDFVRIARLQGGPHDGMDKRILFYSAARGAAQPNSSYAYGVELDYDDKGRIKEKAFLNESGYPAVSKWGYAIARMGYAQNGDLLSLAFFTPDRRPANNSQGIAEVQVQYSAAADSTTQIYFGADGKRTTNVNGVYGERTTLERGRPIVRTDYLTLSDALATNQHGVASRVAEYGKTGYLATLSTFDHNGKATLTGPTGCFQRSFTTGEFGAIQEARCLGLDGKPILSYVGVHSTRYLYDRKGNVLSTSYWLTDNKSPAFQKIESNYDDGAACLAHRAENRFDENGNRIGVRFFDEHGVLTVNERMIAGWNEVYDKNNFLLQTSYIGRDGLSVYNSDAMAVGLAFRYNERGEQTAMTMLGESSGPIKTITAAYDSRGKVISTEFLDAAGNLTRDKDGISGYLSSYDDRGRMYKSRSFGPDRKPERGGSKEVGQVVAFDRFNRVVRAEAIDGQGKPVLNSGGYVSVTNDYETQEYKRVRFLGMDGLPILTQDGIAGWNDRLNARGDSVERHYVGLSGQPVPFANAGLYGYSTSYDAAWNQVGVVYRDAAWKPTENKSNGGIAMTRTSSDRRGRTVLVIYLDKHGKPMANTNKIFGLAYAYDSWGRLGEERLLAEDGKTLNSASSYARLVYAYDKKGRIVEKRYYDARGNPTQATQAAIVRTTYDDFGRAIAYTFFDASLRRILTPTSGRAEARMTYNVYGQVIEEISLGLQGQPVNRKDKGWYRKVSNYDSQGKLQPARCYTVQGVMLPKCSD